MFFQNIPDSALGGCSWFKLDTETLAAYDDIIGQLYMILKLIVA